jgi:hypothetical protein
MREHAITVLTAEREDPRGVGIAADPETPSLIDRTIRALSEA